MPAPTDHARRSRACPRCGREPGATDFFCPGCSARLPDPPPRDVAPQDSSVPQEAGWRVLLTVLAIVVTVGSVLVVAATAVGRLDLFAPDPAPPGTVVQDFLGAADRGDCGSVDDLETADFAAATRCEQSARTFATWGLSEVRVEDVLVVDDAASVRVRLALGGRAVERCTFDLERFDDAWRISDSVCERAARPS